MKIGSMHTPVTAEVPQSTVKSGTASVVSVPLSLEGARQSIAEPQAPARDQVQDAASKLQELAQSAQRNLNFSVDDGSGRVVVKVTDSRSGDVIRQIPSVEALLLAEHLEQASSLLFKAKA
jgi:flagellar protein FlaG